MTYNIFDAHCDTMYELITNKPEENIIKNSLQFNLYNIKNYNKCVQVLALWANPHYKDMEARISMERLVKKTVSHLTEYNADIIKTKSDLLNNKRFGAIIGIEGADAIWTIEDLIYYCNKGVRCITLTWNGSNKIGNGVGSEEKGGLTGFGKEIVLKMNELGMAIDLSHLNEAGFYDAMELTNKPVILSHSNSYKVCNHRRNLTDEQFNAVVKNGGVCGINFGTDFLSDDGEADIKTVISHIEHFCSLGGEKHIGFGSDFDGVSKLPVNINSNFDIYLILDELLKLNYSEEQVSNIAYNNFERCFSEILE